MNSKFHWPTGCIFNPILNLMGGNSTANADCDMTGLNIFNCLKHWSLSKSFELTCKSLDAQCIDDSEWIAWVKWRNSALCWVTRRRAVLVCSFLIFGSAAAMAQEEAAFYKSNCSACHTIGGGPRVGPDLKGVTQRRDRRWLIEFMQDPKKVIDSGDAYAKSLVKASHGIVMPTIQGLDHERAEALLKFVEKQSGSTQSSVGIPAATASSITAEDSSRGRDLFTGRRALANRGPACISCHNVSRVTRLGGGALGPDLTKSVERLGGVSSIIAWLGSTPTPTMRATYTGRALRDYEIRELVAYLESAGDQAKAHTNFGGKWPAAWFLLIGLVSGLGVLGLMALFWKNRFRAVRRPLVTNGGNSYDERQAER